MASYRLTLFGGFQLSGADQGAIAIPAKKARTLLAYLALNPDRPQSREKLAGLLWEESGANQARHSLRQTLSALRKALPDSNAFLTCRPHALTLHPARIEIDALQFERLYARNDPAAFQEALALYRGELLEGLSTRCQGFDDWLEAERSQKREMALQIMAALLEQARAGNELEQTVRLGLRLTALDPLRESTHRLLMETYQRLGRRGAALKQYRLCQQRLRTELGVAPEPETQALFRAIQQAQKQVAPAPVTTSSEEPETAASPATVGQLRPVSLLYLQIDPDGAGEDPERRYREQRQLRTALKARLDTFQASLIELQDGNLLALFGLPSAHSRDTEKAVRAAFAVREDKAGRACRIGISSGPVYLPESVADKPPETVTGTPVQQAMTLAQWAAGGQILIAERAYASVADKVRAEPVGTPNGNSPTPGWRLLGISRELRPPAADIVGRQRELQQFLSAARSCRTIQCGQLFLVRGEPGIGKTRLLQAWRDLAGAEGFDCHLACILDFGAEPGQNPLQQLLRSLLRLDSDCPLPELAARARQGVSEGLLAEDQLDFLFDLLNAPQLLRQPELYHAMDNPAREAGKRELLFALVQALAERRPLLLQVEDIHWAEPALLSLLGELAAAIRDLPVLLVFSTRLEGEPLDPVWRSRLQTTALLTLDIPPLRPAEAAELLAQTLALAPRQAQRLIDRAGGNPLFLEQLRYCAGQDCDTIPDSVQSIVAAKLDGLDGFDKRAAFAAAILGQRFSREALNFILDESGYDCAGLLRAGLIRPEGNQFLFHHALIMEGIYAIQLPSLRRSLHQLAADWYRSRDPALHAEHLDKAESDQAAPAYLAAARQAMNRHQYDQAEKLARRGGETATDEPIRIELQLCLGDTLREQGKAQPALEAFRAAETSAPTPAAQCRALIGQGFALRLLDRHQEVLQITGQAEPLAASLPDAECLATLHYQRGNACFFLGHLDDGMQAHRRAAGLAAANGLPLIQARALSGIADAHYGRGRLLTAEAHYRQSVALCKQHGLISDAAVNQAMISITLGFQNRLEEAENLMRDSLELAQRVRNRRAEAMCLAELGYLCLQTEHREAARRYAETSLRIARELGSCRVECDNLLYLGILDNNEALVEQAHAIAAANPFGQFYNASWILAVLAWITDAPEKRDRALRQAEQLLSQHALSHNVLYFYQYGIEACLKAEDLERARRYRQALEQYSAAEPLPWAAFISRRAAGLIRAAQGETSQELVEELKAILQQADQAGYREARAQLVAALQPLATKTRSSAEP